LLICNVAGKSAAQCRTCTSSFEIFTSAFAKKFFEQMVAFVQSKTWNFTKDKLSKLVDSMKVDFLSPGVNVNIINQKKTP